MPMDAIDRSIINNLQGGFPVCERPYQAAAEQLGIEEQVLIERLQNLTEAGLLSRFGPLYHAEQLGGGLTLAAMKIPPDQFDRVAELVNAHPEVAHNYEREHEMNMWFVLATEKPQQIEEIIQAIEEETGYPVYNMPKQHEFYIGLKFEL